MNDGNFALAYATVVAAVITAIAGWALNRKRKKPRSKLEISEAFESLSSLNSQVVENLSRELHRLNSQLDEMREDLDRYEQRHEADTKEINKLKVQVTGLQNTATRLRAVLTGAGLAIPADLQETS